MAARPVHRNLELHSWQHAVKKFTDRKSAIARIWKAIQPLAGERATVETTVPLDPAPGPQENAATLDGDRPREETNWPTVAAEPEADVIEPIEAAPDATKIKEDGQPSQLSDASPAAAASEPVATEPKPKRERKSAKAPRTAKEAADEPKAERANKKADVIAMMRRADGATLPEIIAATGWQKHTVRGFVSIQGSKGGLKTESSKNDAGDRTYKIVS